MGNFTDDIPDFKTVLFNFTVCPVTSGNNILTQLDIKTEQQWLNITVLAGMFIVFNVVAFIAIRFCKRTK